MDSIGSDALRQVGEILDVLDLATTGNIHTVVVTLNGQHGGADARIEFDQSSDLTLVVR